MNILRRKRTELDRLQREVSRLGREVETLKRAVARLEDRSEHPGTLEVEEHALGAGE